MARTAEDLVADEYLQLQKVVEDFDQRTLTIKAWSVTFSAAGLGLAYAQKASVILIVAALSALVFWIVEALWKTNQQPYYARIAAIEAHFSGDPAATTTPFRIGASWNQAFRAAGGYGRAWRIMLWPHVLLPHAAIVAAGILLFLLMPPQTP